MSADTLDAKSRDFFERAKLKQTASLTFAGIGLLFFGMAVEDGGQSNSATIMEDATSGDTKDMYEALSSGYGFSCFVKLLACLLAFAVSLYFSTFFCGTLNEKKALRSCVEIDENGTPSAAETAGSYEQPPHNTPPPTPPDYFQSQKLAGELPPPPPVYQQVPTTPQVVMSGGDNSSIDKSDIA
jgi:hypothetical protein